MIEKICLMTALVVFCAGCASTACDQDLSYQKAALAPSLKAPPGLVIPAPDPTYRIPPVKGSHQSFLYKAPDSKQSGQKVTRCLALPPPLPSNRGGTQPPSPPKPSV